MIRFPCWCDVGIRNLSTKNWLWIISTFQLYKNLIGKLNSIWHVTETVIRRIKIKHINENLINQNNDIEKIAHPFLCPTPLRENFMAGRVGARSIKIIYPYRSSCQKFGELDRCQIWVRWPFSNRPIKENIESYNDNLPEYGKNKHIIYIFCFLFNIEIRFYDCFSDMFLESFLVCLQCFLSLLLSTEAVGGGEGVGCLGRVARLQGEETDFLRCGSRWKDFDARNI